MRRAWACWCGRTSCWPAPRIQRSRRCGRRSRPRRGRTWSGSHLTRHWCCTTAATRTSGARRTGTGGQRWTAGLGVPGTPTSSFPRSWRSSIRPGRIARTARIRRGVDGSEVPIPTIPITAATTSGRSGTSIDYTAYRSEIPRFCSEFGFQAPPAWRTLTRLGARGRRRCAGSGK